MKSRLKLAVYEAAETGMLDVDDAEAYLDFIECADLTDMDDVDVLTEMVESISGGDAYYESAEEMVLDYLIEAKQEKKDKKKATAHHLNLMKKNKKDGGKVAQLKATLAKNKKKIIAGAVGTAALAGAGVAGYKNKDKIVELAKKLGKKGESLPKNSAYPQSNAFDGLSSEKMDKIRKAQAYVDAHADEYNESVEDLIYESVENGDITVTEAAELLEMLD